jgi:hypothetical protein
VRRQGARVKQGVRVRQGVGKLGHRVRRMHGHAVF